MQKKLLSVFLIFCVILLFLSCGDPVSGDPIVTTRLEVSESGTAITYEENPAVTITLAFSTLLEDVSITLANSTEATATLNVAVPVISDTTNYTITDTASFDTALTPGESTAFTIRFMPTSGVGTYDATVTITSDDTAHPVFTFGVQGIQE